MESVTVRLDTALAKKIDTSLKPYYSTKTEFIREAIREKLKRLEQEQFLYDLRKGAVPKRTSPITQQEYDEFIHS